MRLNVIGVSIFFFLPRFVTSRTSGDEFHSLNDATYPSDSSHLCRSDSCVLFPEPSIPSTMKRRPGKRCLPYIFMLAGTALLLSRIRFDSRNAHQATLRQNHRRQAPAIHAAGVDPDRVLRHVWGIEYPMPEYGRFPFVLVEPWSIGIAAPPDTGQVLDALPLQSNPGPKPRVHNQLIAEIDQLGEPRDPFHITVEKSAEGCDRLPLRPA